MMSSCARKSIHGVWLERRSMWVDEMRLPGTRYQEPGWEQVRKLLGLCSLQVLAQLDLDAPEAALEDYVDAMGDALHAQRHTARARQDGNSYGDSVLELAQDLLFELRARPADWHAAWLALVQDRGASEAGVRKKFNDLYAVLRDKVDADNFMVACGRPCSPNKIYTYRMLDTARAAILALLRDWQANAAQLALILGREIVAQPIESRSSQVRAEWVIRWSAAQEQFGSGPGPLHTKSKRFASLKNNPDTIAALLAEIDEYEAVSANRDCAWAQDADSHEAWIEDLWRVMDESQAAERAGRIESDCLLAPAPDELYERAEDEAQEVEAVIAPDLAPQAPAAQLPAGWRNAAQRAEDHSSHVLRLLEHEEFVIRLAVYLKIFGPCDDTYPSEWLDPATGALPNMQQLAALAQVSLPTLRKRRDAAIAILQAAPGPTRRVTWMS